MKRVMSLLSKIMTLKLDVELKKKEESAQNVIRAKSFHAKALKESL